MSAAAYLKQQHREVEALFERVDGADASQRPQLVRQLADQLAAHMVVEEEIFYPAARDAIDDAERIEESVEEHELARSALRRLITAVDRGEDELRVRLRVLRELVDHHVGEEEEELLTEVEDAIDSDIQAELVQQMRVVHGNAIEVGHEQVLSGALVVPSRRAPAPPPPLASADRSRSA